MQSSICVYVCIDTYTHIHVCIRACLHTYITCIHTYMHAFIHTSTHANITCTNTHTHTHIHTYIHTYGSDRVSFSLIWITHLIIFILISNKKSKPPQQTYHRLRFIAHFPVLLSFFGSLWLSSAVGSLLKFPMTLRVFRLSRMAFDKISLHPTEYFPLEKCMITGG